MMGTRRPRDGAGVFVLRDSHPAKLPASAEQDMRHPPPLWAGEYFGVRSRSQGYPPPPKAGSIRGRQPEPGVPPSSLGSIRDRQSGAEGAPSPHGEGTYRAGRRKRGTTPRRKIRRVPKWEPGD